MPNGELDGRQLRFLGDAIAPYGENGCADITTRAAIQLRGIPLEDADVIIKGLWDVNLTSFMTGMVSNQDRLINSKKISMNSLNVVSAHTSLTFFSFDGRTMLGI